MVKFFSKIRKNLLDAGKVGSYLKYAIGEIFLVVIGILIAFQVNTWNENRKLSNQEKLYIHRLLQDNKKDIITFTSEIARLESYNRKTADFCNAFKDKNCSDSLLIKSASEFIIYGSLYPRFNPFTSTFEDLSSTGNLGIIKDTAIRDRIVSHYQYYQAVEWEFKINLNWATPIDAPLFINADALKYETATTSFLFPDESISSQADDLRKNQALYIRNAALHYWINVDCITALKQTKEETETLVALLEDVIYSEKY